MTSAQRRSLASVAIFLMAVAVYARNLFGGATLMLRDHLSLVTPARTFLGESLRNGRLPQWWPGVGMGTPFAANPMHGSLYPPAWLAMLSPGSLGADLVIVLHVFLLGLGTSKFATQLGADLRGATLSAAIAMTCGYTASMAALGIPLMTLAWLPWVGWATHKVASQVIPNKASASSRLALLPHVLPNITWLALIYAATLLSGDPAGAITASLLSLGILLTCTPTHYKIAFLCAIIAATLGVLLAAIVILPALHLVAESNRSGGMSLSTAGAWSMHPARFLEWFWPQAMGSPVEPDHNLATVFANSSQDRQMAPTWSLSLFIGFPVFFLALLSRLRRLAWVLFFFVLIALGTYTPLYELFRTLFLPERLVRYPERHLAGFFVLLAALAGVGCSNLLKEGFVPSRLFKRCALFTLLLTLVFLAIAIGARGSIIQTLQSSATRAGLDATKAWDHVTLGASIAFVSMFAAVVAIYSHTIRGNRKLATALVFFAVGVPLFRESLVTQPVIDRTLLSQTPQLLETITPSASPRPRLYRHSGIHPQVGDVSREVQALVRHHTAAANMATAFGFDYVPGYDPSLSSRLRKTWDAATSKGARILQRFDIEYIFMPTESAKAAGLQVVATSLDPKLALARIPSRRPRAFVALQWQWISSDDSFREQFAADHIAPHTIYLLGDGPPAPSTTALLPPIPCTIASQAPETVTLTCNAPQPGYAVLLDAWAPGWTAQVDGSPSSILRVDSLVRAVAIESGLHTIVFHYTTPGLKLGAFLSGLGLLLLLGLWTAALRLAPKTHS